MAEAATDPSPSLWICATPIGNMADVSERLKQTLSKVDHIFCEDTRVTGLLMQHLGFKKSLHSCHKFSERRAAEQVIEYLQNDLSVAYVSDAGTPGISDPGALLVKAVRQAGFSVKVVPGPSAVATLMSVSGYDAAFAFVGFLPRKTKPIIETVTTLLDLELAIVFYESPHRIQKSVAALAEKFPEHRIFIARELTKAYEEFFEGTLLEVSEQLQQKEHWKGEFAGVVFKNPDKFVRSSSSD